MSFTCLVASPHLKENCAMGSINSELKLILICQIFKSRNQKSNQTTFVSAIKDLGQEFSSRFVDFWQYANAFKLFGTPFQTNVEEVEEKYQLKLIDLQCDDFLEARYDSASTVEFYQKYVAPRKKFPNLLQNAKIMTLLFASTYCCEQLFSKMLKLFKIKPA